MRQGKNPAKETARTSNDIYHRVVVPIYIPNTTEDYFKEALDVLTLSLESLLRTVHKNTRITLINNGCCLEVVTYLKELFVSDNAVDQLLHFQTNLGKVNALRAGALGNAEAFFTITDADVLFKNDWQSAVENVFNAFPQAGMVSPVPVSNMFKHKAASSTFGYGLLKNIIKFKKVIDPDGLKKFEQSVGANLFKGKRLEQFLCLENKKGAAVISCGHFVATLRAEVFFEGPNEPSSLLIDSKEDFKYIDKPNNEMGYLRLATLNNYAYHMGNRVAPWMKDILLHLHQEEADGAFKNNLPKATKRSSWKVSFYKTLHRLFLIRTPIRKRYFRKLGMKDSSY